MVSRAALAMILTAAGIARSLAAFAYQRNMALSGEPTIRPKTGVAACMVVKQTAADSWFLHYMSITLRLYQTLHHAFL